MNVSEMGESGNLVMHFFSVNVGNEHRVRAVLRGFSTVLVLAGCG